MGHLGMGASSPKMRIGNGSQRLPFLCVRRWGYSSDQGHQTKKITKVLFFSGIIRNFAHDL